VFIIGPAKPPYKSVIIRHSSIIL